MTNSVPITEEQKTLVKSTWRKLEPIAPQAAALFYDNLFRTNPSLQSLFSATHMPAQEDKLVHAISAVVHSIDRIENIQPLLEDLGRRHADYGVTESHYDDVGSALVQTLKTGLGHEWTQPVHKAWLATYTIVASTMLGKRIA